MNRRFSHTGDSEALRAELRAALAELEELNQQLRSFETLVDSHLGSLLDQLSMLNADTQALNGELRLIRDQRLFGNDVMRYVDGAPQPARPPDLSDLPPVSLQRGPIGMSDSGNSLDEPLPELKALYRKLARRYHPDLARNSADRTASNETMAEINQAYAAGDMSTLLRLAGMGLPYGVNLPQPALQLTTEEISMLPVQEIAGRLNAVRTEIDRLSRLPMVKLSLDVKLARRQNRDLLQELAAELRYKVARKTAERDYLRAQIKVSGSNPPSDSAE